MSWFGERRALVKIFGPGKGRSAMEEAQREICSRCVERRDVMLFVCLFVVDIVIGWDCYLIDMFFDFSRTILSLGLAWNSRTTQRQRRLNIGSGVLFCVWLALESERVDRTR